MARPYMQVSLTLDTSVDTTKTSAVQVPEWARYGMVYQPAHTDGTLSMEMATNEDIGYPTAVAAELLASDDSYWALVANNGESTQIAGSGALEANWIDISDYLQSLPRDCFIRFVLGAAETGGSALTFKVVFRGA